MKRWPDKIHAAFLKLLTERPARMKPGDRLRYSRRSLRRKAREVARGSAVTS